MSEFQEVGPFSPALSVDTSYGDWSSSPSPGPLSPSSCSELMSSPVLSPEAFSSPHMEHFELSSQKTFDAYSFPSSFEHQSFVTSPFGVDQSAMYAASPLYAQQQHVDFSAFMNSIPQFDI